MTIYLYSYTLTQHQHRNLIINLFTFIYKHSMPCYLTSPLCISDMKKFEYFIKNKIIRLLLFDSNLFISHLYPQSHYLTNLICR